MHIAVHTPCCLFYRIYSSFPSSSLRLCAPAGELFLIFYLQFFTHRVFLSAPSAKSADIRLLTGGTLLTYFHGVSAASSFRLEFEVLVQLLAPALLGQTQPFRQMTPSE